MRATHVAGNFLRCWGWLGSPEALEDDLHPMMFQVVYGSSSCELFEEVFPFFFPQKKRNWDVHGT